MKCKVMKEGLARKTPEGSLIDYAIGDVGEFSVETFDWLGPLGALEAIEEAAPIAAVKPRAGAKKEVSE